METYIMFRQKQINSLDKIAEEFGCELLLPPGKKIGNPFFDISEIKHKPSIYKKFLARIEDMGNIAYSSTKNGNKLFLEVKHVCVE